MHKYIITALLIIITTLPAMGHSWISDSILKSWGGRPKFIGCGENLTGGCIGKKLREKNCNVYDANMDAFTFMMARKVNEHGAYFCPTTLDRHNYPFEGTRYSEPTGNRECRWLCKEGWTGPECNTPANEYKGACDVWPFLQTDYDNVAPDPQIISIDWDFKYVKSDSWASCKARNGKISKSEHDIVLAVNRFLDSGNGAMARMMEVSSRKDKTENKADLQVYPAQATNDILLCKQGYKHNAGWTDCEPINSSECNKAVMSQRMCSGWDTTQYDESIHVAELADGCYKYKCKQDGYTFSSTSDHKCIECAKGARGGPHPTDGTCVKCDTGRVFNATDSANGYCSQAIGLTHNDLMWGRGKTKGDYKTLDIKQQCWTMTSPDEYRNCVLNRKSQTPVDPDE